MVPHLTTDADLSEEERIARIICDVWEYLWDGDPETDDQVIPDVSDAYDDRPDKRSFISAGMAIKSQVLAPILAQVSALQAENRDLRLELAEAKQELDEADARHSAAENAWSEATARVSALQAEVEALKRDCFNAEQAASVEASERRRLQAEVERLQKERDEARRQAGLDWTAADVDAWGRAAEEKGLPHFRDRLNRIFRRAISAEERERELLEIDRGERPDNDTLLAAARHELEEALERLQKVEGEREKDAERVPTGPCWSDKPEPVPVSALRATITSRTLPAGTLQIYRGIATGTTGAFMAPADVALLISEIDRLTQRLINGPASMQECAEFCRLAREDGDGKPCLDCHPENFTF